MMRKKTYSIALAATLFLWLSGCNWQGESQRDNTQDDLKVVLQIPAQQTRDPIATIPKAPVDGTIAVAFSRAMDPCSFTLESFLVSTGGNPLSGVILHRTTSSYPNGFVVFQPATLLAYATSYTVTIKAGVRALNGALLSSDYTWDFTTVQQPAANPPAGSAALSIAQAGPLATPSITCETPAAAIQNDGKVIAAGHINGTNFSEFTVARYNVNGGLDTTFAGDGITMAVIGGGNSRALAATVQADGKVVAVGVSSNATDKDFALARYLADGSFDPTFSDDGRRHADLGTGDERALAVAVQADNKIMVAGSGNDGTAFILARYNVDGSADTAFGTNGIASASATVSSEASYAMVLQGDGKIVVASKALVGAVQATVTRYNADGSVDLTFNGGVP
ncbi:MAG: Delta-60 repeat-containing protein, partial [Halothiobacillaceae bacterium]